MKPGFLPYGTQYIDEETIQDVVEVLHSDFLSQGPKIKEFEAQMARRVGARYCVAVANGTAALHLAVAALDIPPGLEGITSPNTFVASANCFLYNHLLPAFIDIDEKTYCIDANGLEKGVNGTTGVVIPVHFAGQTCDMEKIKGICEKKRKKGKGAPYIIEDASHAIGSTYENGKPVGCSCYSDMTTFSFHPVKTITTGEGGVITTGNENLYERLLMLRNHGITKEKKNLKNPKLTSDSKDQEEYYGPWYYEMQTLGFNYRMTELQAALGIGQLRKLDEFIQRRTSIMKAYDEAFKSIPWLTVPFRRPDRLSVLHLYVVLIDFKMIGKNRSQVMAELAAQGIGTQVHYIPVHLQPYYRQHFGFKKGDFPQAENYYDHCLSIPLFPRMTGNDVERVINAITTLGKTIN